MQVTCREFELEGKKNRRHLAGKRTLLVYPLTAGDDRGSSDTQADCLGVQPLLHVAVALQARQEVMTLHSHLGVEQNPGG